MSGKTEVYSWRLTPALKMALEEAARDEGVSLARLLERITGDWLETRTSADHEDEQERIRASAMRFVGKLRSGDPELAEKASERVREHLARARAR